MKRNILGIVFILLLLCVSSLYIFSQDDSINNNDVNKNDNNNIIKQINKNYDQNQNTDVDNNSIKTTNNSTNNILFRTFLVSFILLLVFIAIKVFFNKYGKTTINGKLANIIYEEYFYKNYKIGIMKSLDHYFLVSFTPRLNILYEFTEKEDIDNILLLKSKQNETKKSFRDFLKGFNIGEKQNLTNNDFLKGLKHKINNISRSQDE